MCRASVNGNDPGCCYIELSSDEERAGWARISGGSASTAFKRSIILAQDLCYVLGAKEDIMDKYRIKSGLVPWTF